MAEPSRKRVVIYGDGDRPDVQHAIRQVMPLVREKADIVAVCTDLSLDLEAFEFDLLLNFGGDGSMLGAARSMGRNQVPVAGVNFGKVGFLATFEMAALLVELDALLDGDVERRLRHRECLILEANVLRRDGGVVERHLALNDVVVTRGEFSRIIKLECSVDDEFVTRYDVDGIIISSPIGSTAHSLSAGGPVLEPDMAALIVTPLCAHTLSTRPLVMPSSRTVELRLTESDTQVGVTFDGQSFAPFSIGDTIRVGAFEHRFILLGARRPGFYASLRSKLLWSGSVEGVREQASAWHLG